MFSLSYRFSVNNTILACVLLTIFILTGCSKNAPQTLENEKKQAPNEGKNLSTYTVKRTTAPVKIDGHLDEADWKRAVEAPLRETNTGEDVPLKSTVKLLWDDKYLYVGFYCEDPDAWATYTEEDDPLWKEEVVEMFIDPDGNGYNYYEHEINPINVKVDLFVLNAGKRLDGKIQGWFEWDFADIRSAVHVEGDGKNVGTDDKYWSVEVAVPFDDLWELPQVPPEDGDMWRFNAYRIERGNPDDEKDDWYAAFSPTLRGSFHTPWQFGKIYFKK